MSLYLWLHVFTVLFPLVRSFEPKVAYASRWGALFPAILLTAGFFIAWDVHFAGSGVWGFNRRYLLGLHIAGLPIEEWIFFVTIPFSSVFIYDCVVHFDKKKRFYGSFHAVSLVLGIGLFASSFIFVLKDYTFYCFLLTGAFLIVHGAVIRQRYMGHFYLAYFVHLVPFVVVNGILTGGVTEEPIVWYNAEENLGIRFWTIPAEDFVYALFLLLMNVSWYEFFKKRQAEKHI